MENRLNPLARIALFAACAALPLLGGCENEETTADRRVREGLEAAEFAYARGEESARDTLAQAGTELQASGGMQATAKAALANKDYLSALAIKDELDFQEREASRLIGDMAVVASRVAANHITAAAYDGANPVGKAPNEPLKAFGQLKTQATEQLARTEEQIKSLEGEVAKKTAEIEKLRTDQSAASAQAGSLQQQADATPGRQSVDLFNQALAARKQSTDLAYQLNLAQQELTGLQARLAEAQQMKAIAQDSIQVIQQQIDSLNSSWRVAEQAKKSQRSASQDILASAGFAADAKALLAAMAAADEYRDKIAGNHLQAAADNYEAASRGASALVAALTTRMGEAASQDSASRAMLTKLSQAYDPLIYKLGKAQVLKTRGLIYASHARLLQAYQQLLDSVVPVFREAGLALPEGLVKTNLKQQAEAARGAATEDFQQADQVFTDAISRGEGPVKNEGAIGHISTQYALYQLTGNKEFFKTARTVLAELVKDNPKLHLPLLPTDLEAEIVQRAAAAVPPPAPGGRTAPPAGQSGNTTTPPEGDAGAAQPRGSGGSPWSSVFRRAGGAFRQGGGANPGQPGGNPAPAPDNANPADNANPPQPDENK